MNNTSGVISVIARCLECGKEWDDMNTARNNAYAHARRTGHKVDVESVHWTRYN